MPDGAAPGDYPPVNELDLLNAFTLAEVNKVAAEHLNWSRPSSMIHGTTAHGPVTHETFE